MRSAIEIVGQINQFQEVSNPIVGHKYRIRGTEYAIGRCIKFCRETSTVLLVSPVKNKPFKRSYRIEELMYMQSDYSILFNHF